MLEVKTELLKGGAAVTINKCALKSLMRRAEGSGDHYVNRHELKISHFTMKMYSIAMLL